MNFGGGDMDAEVRATLERAGFQAQRTELLRIPIEVSPQGGGRPLGEEVPVMEAGSPGLAMLKLKPCAQLWTGTAVPPSMAGTPPEEYQPFFLMLEMTAANYCATTRKVVADAEFERLYRQLRRRPDGTEANPLFSYLRAAARLYLSLRNVSRAEFEAVAQRLSQSARHFASHVGSTNYYQLVLHDLLGA
ncbi:hypothetical protein NR798_14610 [Archangium gephyra]|uniref:hypothetical protein n=1 Tax=Archangium gephyra TaxID=48 RepID=UPI0035D46D19